jgi:pyridoxamine 5'-phosphate oxidase
MFEPQTEDPFEQFGTWFEEAKASEPNDPNAMTVATVDRDGFPAARILLLKDFDTRGFVFYTNTESDKGRQLAANPKVALCFHWKSLLRQVRIVGPVSHVSDEEADAYFQSRARGSRIGAWASSQSRPLADRDTLMAEVARVEAQYEGGEVPRPPHWTGFRLKPHRIEFWQDGEFRLHDRFIFTRPEGTESWAIQRLYP